MSKVPFGLLLENAFALFDILLSSSLKSLIFISSKSKSSISSIFSTFDVSSFSPNNFFCIIKILFLFSILTMPGLIGEKSSFFKWTELVLLIRRSSLLKIEDFFLLRSFLYFSLISSYSFWPSSINILLLFGIMFVETFVFGLEFKFVILLDKIIWL